MKPDSAIEIIRKLRDANHEAYLVGGCVRDMVMGIEPADYDIATNALMTSAPIITCLLENRSTNVPAIGDIRAKGNRRATKKMPAAVGEAPETRRTSPRPAIKLNQFPSSEINCPASKLRKLRFDRISSP